MIDWKQRAVWMNDWLNWREKACAGSSDLLGQEDHGWLTCCCRTVRKMECHLQLSHLCRLLGGDLGLGSQNSLSRCWEISRWYPAAHKMDSVVLTPCTTNKLLLWRKKYNKGEKSHRTRERFYTRHILYAPVIIAAPLFLLKLGVWYCPWYVIIQCLGLWSSSPETFSLPSLGGQLDISIFYSQELPTEHLTEYILKERFKETLNEVRGWRKGAESGVRRYGNVITIGSVEILVGGDEENKEEKQRLSPKHYSLQDRGLPSCLHSPRFNSLFFLTTTPHYQGLCDGFQWNIMGNASTPLADQKQK